MREGVPTLPTLIARQSHHPTDSRLLELLSGPITDDSKHAEALRLLRSNPAMTKARLEVQRRAERGPVAARRRSRHPGPGGAGGPLRPGHHPLLLNLPSRPIREGTGQLVSPAVDDAAEADLAGGLLHTAKSALGCRVGLSQDGLELREQGRGLPLRPLQRMGAQLPGEVLVVRPDPALEREDHREHPRQALHRVEPGLEHPTVAMALQRPVDVVDVAVEVGLQHPLALAAAQGAPAVDEPAELAVGPVQQDLGVRERVALPPTGRVRVEGAGTARRSSRVHTGRSIAADLVVTRPGRDARSTTYTSRSERAVAMPSRAAEPGEHQPGDVGVALDLSQQTGQLRTSGPLDLVRHPPTLPRPTIRPF